MILIFLVAFVGALLLNIYITVFGKQDLEKLKTKISLRKYISEIWGTIDSNLGHNTTTFIKLGMIGLCILIVIFNAFALLVGFIAVSLGTLAAKKSYQVGSVNGLLRKVATYINRARTP